MTEKLAALAIIGLLSTLGAHCAVRAWKNTHSQAKRLEMRQNAIPANPKAWLEYQTRYNW